jgi:mRNA-degrading endonuclease RelE of RelBE toxin-antitoxin system
LPRTITLSPRGERDLRRVPVSQRLATLEGLHALADEHPGADIKALAGHRGWYRLRVGDWWVLYLSDPPGVRIDRIVNHRDLERALATLP